MIIFHLKTFRSRKNLFYATTIKEWRKKHPKNSNIYKQYEKFNRLNQCAIADFQYEIQCDETQDIIKENIDIIRKFSENTNKTYIKEMLNLLTDRLYIQLNEKKFFPKEFKAIINSNYIEMFTKYSSEQLEEFYIFYIEQFLQCFLDRYNKHIISTIQKIENLDYIKLVRQEMQIFISNCTQSQLNKLKSKFNGQIIIEEILEAYFKDHKKTKIKIILEMLERYFTAYNKYKNNINIPNKRYIEIINLKLKNDKYSHFADIFQLFDMEEIAYDLNWVYSFFTEIIKKHNNVNIKFKAILNEIKNQK